METRVVRTHELSNGFRIVIGRLRPVLSSSLDLEVEHHWQNVLRTNSALFNGSVFSADIVSQSLIIGHWTEFRRVVAQVRDPHLYAKLGLRPVSVSGVLICADEVSKTDDLCPAVVLGRRNAQSIFQASVWQLPPAGSLDDSLMKGHAEVDWREQLIRELEEELGIPADAVRQVQPICMAEYSGSHSLEIGIQLVCLWTSSSIIEAHKRSGNTEYEELRAIKIADLMKVTDQLGERLSPPARIFLRRLIGKCAMINV